MAFERVNAAQSRALVIDAVLIAGSGPRVVRREGLVIGAASTGTGIGAAGLPLQPVTSWLTSSGGSLG
jgi:hypothetical protein